MSACALFFYGSSAGAMRRKLAPPRGGVAEIPSDGEELSVTLSVTILWLSSSIALIRHFPPVFSPALNT
jgi:hypothetical protein